MRFDLRGLVVPAATVLAWELAYRSGAVASESLSHPSAIGRALAAAVLDLSLIKATLKTAIAASCGLLVGSCIGIGLGALAGTFRTAAATLGMVVEALRPLPAAALMPVALLLFGFSYTMEASVVAFAVTWPMFLITAAAVKAVDTRYFDVARVLKLSLAQTALHIVAPAVFVRVADGMKLAVALSLVVAVTVEISVNPQGLGYLMVEAQQSFRPDLVMASLFWIGLLGVAVNRLTVGLAGK